MNNLTKYLISSLLLENEDINELQPSEIKYWALHSDVFDALKKDSDYERVYIYLKNKLTGEKLEALEYFYNEYFLNPKNSIKELLNTPSTFKEALKSLTNYMIDQGMNIKPLPRIISISNDSKNAENILGKTAHYNPNNCSITLFTLGRHSKDILRSYAHEMIHRIQDNEGRLKGINTTNTNEDDELLELEKEAYLYGNTTFRNWEDSIKNVKPLNEGNAYDKTTGLIVDKIWTYIKDSVGGDEKQAYKTTMKIDGLIFLLTIIIYRPEIMDYGSKVDANSDKNEIDILITLNKENEKLQYIKLNAKLQDAVRHEIEHTLQDPKSPNYKEGLAKPTSKSYRIKANKDPYIYFQLRDEIPAMVKGMFRQSKTEKRPLDDIFNEYLSGWIELEDITQEQADKIVKKWIEYAKKYIPSAKYSNV